MKNSKPVGLFVSMLFGAALCGAGAAHAAKISISCGAVGQEYELCKHGAEAWAKKTGNEVNLVSTPNSATERLALYQQLLAAGASDIDVFQIDVVWPGILGQSLHRSRTRCQGASLNASFPGHRREQHRRRQAGGHALVHRCRPALLPQGPAARSTAPKPPANLGRTDRHARKKIQDAERKAGNDKMWGFVFQGRAYEGLTCNALEWVASYGGGTIVDNDGQDHHQQPAAPPPRSTPPPAGSARSRRRAC